MDIFGLNGEKQMGSKASGGVKSIDGLLKAMLVFSRTVDHSLETNAVKTAVGVALSSSKVQILRLLGHRGGQTASQLARYLGVSKPAVSQIIDTMVRAKLVKRVTAKEDRREVNLSLSAKGKGYAQKMLREQRQFLKNAMKKSRGLSVTRAVKTLQDLTEGLAKADKRFDHYCLQCGAHGDATCVLPGGESECLYMQHEAELRRRALARRSG